MAALHDRAVRAAPAVPLLASSAPSHSSARLLCTRPAQPAAGELISFASPLRLPVAAVPLLLSDFPRRALPLLLYMSSLATQFFLR